ncbi:MAG: hypothetical protein IJR00_10290 [Lachnospiraceae bacterium]|nr:hypothetical protein [Lachnospiraceae bacterium]
MTEKELRKLSRVELLKLLVEVTEENEMLRAQLQGQQELAERAQIQDSQEVRDSVEDVFRTVESTATGFLSKAQGIADQIMEDARVRAEQIIRDAETQAARRAAYEPFTAAAPEMQQVIEEIALEQSPQQSAEDAFETDALFEGTNATEVTEKRLTEVRVTEPAPLAAEPEETPAAEMHADVPEAEIAGEPEIAAEPETEDTAEAEDIAEAETYVAAEPEAEDSAEPEAYETEAEPEDAAEPEAYIAAKPRRAPQTRAGVRSAAAQPAAAAVYPEQIAPQEDNFRIEGLEDTAAPQWLTETAQTPEDGMPQAETPAAPQDKPLTAIDMLKRLQGGA